MSEMNVSATRDKYCLLTGRAIVTEGKKDVDKAAQLYEELVHRWAAYGFVLEEGQAHLGLARCLIALGDREAATEPLRKARAIFLRLSAQPLMDEVDRYLPEATALSS